MIITLENKTFELKFGFKCFLNLGRALGLKTVNEVIDRLSSFDGKSDDITFDQLELIEKLIISAAQANPKYGDLGYSINDVNVIDGVMAQPGMLSELITELNESFNKAEGKGQANPAVRKTQTRKR